MAGNDLKTALLDPEMALFALKMIWMTPKIQYDPESPKMY